MNTPFAGRSFTDALVALERMRATYDVAFQCEASPADRDVAHCTDAHIEAHSRKGLPERGWTTRIPTGISGTLTFQTPTGVTFRLDFAGPVRH